MVVLGWLTADSGDRIYFSRLDYYTLLGYYQPS